MNSQSLSIFCRLLEEQERVRYHLHWDPGTARGQRGWCSPPALSPGISSGLECYLLLPVLSC